MSARVDLSLVWAVIAMLASFCPACEAEPQPQRGDRVVVYIDGFEETRPRVCRGDLEALDAEVERFETIFGVMRPQVLEIHLDGPFPEGCAENLLGCYVADQDAIYTSWHALTHEMAHAVQWYARDPDLEEFWVEGTAEALDQQGTLFAGPIAEYVDERPLSKEGYAVAPHFVRWLYETRGGAANLAALNAGVPFEEVYGLELAEAESLFLETAPYRYPEFGPCEGERLEQASDDSFETSVHVDCIDGHDTTAARSAGAIRSIVVRQSGRFRMSVQEGAALSFALCEVEPLEVAPPPGDSFVQEGRLRWSPGSTFGTTPLDLDLSAGIYEVGFELEIGTTEGTVSARLERLE